MLDVPYSINCASPPTQCSPSKLLTPSTLDPDCSYRRKTILQSKIPLKCHIFSLLYNIVVLHQCRITFLFNLIHRYLPHSDTNQLRLYQQIQALATEDKIVQLSFKPLTHLPEYSPCSFYMASLGLCLVASWGILCCLT